MQSRSLCYALAGCLLHATFASARVGIKIPIPVPIVINATTVFTVAFSFLVIFAVLTGILWVGGIGKACGAKNELPPDVSPIKYDVGRLYGVMVFIAASLWWSQLIIYTVYVRDVFMRTPRRAFPESAYIARFALGQLSDIFIAASVFQLVHYRRKIHTTIIAPFSAPKRAFDIGFLIVHVGVFCYTTAFHSISITDPDSDSKFLNWLTSYYVYTTVYVLMVVNVTATFHISTKALKGNFIKDEPCHHANSVPGSMITHALFKIIMAVLYSQFDNPKVDLDVLRVFEVIVLSLTYFIALFGLMMAGDKSTEDDKKLKEIKKLEKEAKEAKEAKEGDNQSK